MNLSIIIVNWNSCEYLRRCIASLAEASSGLRCEIVVIDSGSFDGSDQMVRTLYPDVKFIQSQVNVGFAKANNLAFAQSIGDIVLFLNPDTEVVGSAVVTLWSVVRSCPDAGAVGCRVLNSDGTVQLSCISALPTILNKVLDSNYLRNRWPRSRLWGMSALYEESNGAKEVEAISGACLMMKRSVFERIGKFSEDYFMYAEDIDLAFKARRGGYKNYYVPAASVIHHGGSSSHAASSTFAAVMMPEATWRFFRKTRGAAYGCAYRLAMLLAAICRLVLLLIASPFRMWSGETASWRASVARWRAVVTWCLKRDNLVRRFYPDCSRRLFSS